MALPSADDLASSGSDEREVKKMLPATAPQVQQLAAPARLAKELLFSLACLFLPLFLLLPSLQRGGSNTSGGGEEEHSGCIMQRTAGLILSRFPCGATLYRQLLHVLSAPRFYWLSRPLLLGDWVVLLWCAAHLVIAAATATLLAAYASGLLLLPPEPAPAKPGTRLGGGAAGASPSAATTFAAAAAQALLRTWLRFREPLMLVAAPYKCGLAQVMFAATWVLLRSKGGGSGGGIGGAAGAEAVAAAAAAAAAERLWRWRLTAPAVLQAAMRSQPLALAALGVAAAECHQVRPHVLARVALAAATGCTAFLIAVHPHHDNAASSSSSDNDSISSDGSNSTRIQATNGPDYAHITDSSILVRLLPMLPGFLAVFGAPVAYSHARAYIQDPAAAAHGALAGLVRWGGARAWRRRQHGYDKGAEELAAGTGEGPGASCGGSGPPRPPQPQLLDTRPSQQSPHRQLQQQAAAAESATTRTVPVREVAPTSPAATRAGTSQTLAPASGAAAVAAVRGGGGGAPAPGCLDAVAVPRAPLALPAPQRPLPSPHVPAKPSYARPVPTVTVPAAGVGMPPSGSGRSGSGDSRDSVLYAPRQRRSTVVISGKFETPPNMPYNEAAAALREAALAGVREALRQRLHPTPRLRCQEAEGGSTRAAVGRLAAEAEGSGGDSSSRRASSDGNEGGLVRLECLTLPGCVQLTVVVRLGIGDDGQGGGGGSRDEQEHGDVEGESALAGRGAANDNSPADDGDRTDLPRLQQHLHAAAVEAAARLGMTEMVLSPQPPPTAAPLLPQPGPVQALAPAARSSASPTSGPASSTSATAPHLCRPLPSPPPLYAVPAVLPCDSTGQMLGGGGGGSEGPLEVYVFMPPELLAAWGAAAADGAHPSFMAVAMNPAAAAAAGSPPVTLPCALGTAASASLGGGSSASSSSGGSSARSASSASSASGSSAGCLRVALPADLPSTLGLQAGAGGGGSGAGAGEVVVMAPGPHPPAMRLPALVTLHVLGVQAKAGAAPAGDTSGEAAPVAQWLGSVPLLVAPSGPAGELAELWGRMVEEVEGQAQAEQAWQQQPRYSPYAALAFESHMAPLIEDLAAAGGGGGGGVLGPHLVQYLDSMGLGQTLAWLGSGGGSGGHGGTGAAAEDLRPVSPQVEEEATASHASNGSMAVQRTLALLTQPSPPPPGLRRPSSSPTALITAVTSPAAAAVQRAAAAAAASLRTLRTSLLSLGRQLRVCLLGFPDPEQEAEYGAWQAARAGSSSSLRVLAACAGVGAVSVPVTKLRLAAFGIRQPLLKALAGALWLTAPLTGQALRLVVLRAGRRAAQKAVLQKLHRREGEGGDIQEAGSSSGTSGVKATSISSNTATTDAGTVAWRDTLASACTGLIASLAGALTYTCSRPQLDVRQDELGFVFGIAMGRSVLTPLATQLRLRSALLAVAGMFVVDLVHLHSLWGGGGGGEEGVAGGGGAVSPAVLVAAAGLIALFNLAISVGLSAGMRREFLAGSRLTGAGAVGKGEGLMGGVKGGEQAE